MTKKLFISTILIAFLSGNLLSESIEEIIVLEKKLSSLNGWSNNQSITSINEKELGLMSRGEGGPLLIGGGSYIDDYHVFTAYTVYT